ncbi:M15 family metallopeptidase [Thioalbus denitrificans]|uniref:Peptidoglycan L-alanyl-D-glutamate endopeptidase CwlK n=1 Tax=Thioalbus denitrificans TaxID=547122 RepID=A0A369CDK7_9GAMM|nr:M15 family metallopeptidase [Thioalbus denitrificans]RCX32090.1 peptidoglycan L-alanyl-D-glutamate endopeptidase CwlK [Thioalbus denitrificans]
MASRRLDDLQPYVAEMARELVRLADGAGLDLLIYCTLRSAEEQARLFRRGRALREIERKAREMEALGRSDFARLLMDVGPQYGPGPVTWAGPGQSLHQYGVALDAVPLRDGKPVWATAGADGRPDWGRPGVDGELWDRYGALGERVGFEWSGRWSPHHREYPHLQAAGVDWRDLIRQGHSA